VQQDQPHELTRARWLLWFLLGVSVALSLQTLQAMATGGWDGLVNVGEDSSLRPFIEQELGRVATTPGGHDGQFSLVLALDPFGRTGTHRLFDHDAYRYRRILYPLLSGGFGLVHGRAVLAGLVLVAAFGVGLATASVARLAGLLGARLWVVFGVLANPGVWMSVQLLTSDTLALGLSLTGVVLWLERRRAWALVIFALALLTKDQYLLVPLAIAGWAWSRGLRRQAALVAVVPALPLIAWATSLDLILGGGFATRSNVALLGVLDSARVWTETLPAEQALIGVTIAGLCIAAVAPFRAGKLFRWLAWPWVLLALTTSTWVWDLGNNAARVLTPLWVLGLLALSVAIETPRCARVPRDLQTRGASTPYQGRIP